jgi:3-hydroxyisobutyrate dehydrogenase-like beta-hydroxyacid dehydrogenase
VTAIVGSTSVGEATTPRTGCIEGAPEPALFALSDQVKDPDLAPGMDHAAGTQVPITELVRKIYADALPDAGRLDLSAIPIR